MENKPSKEDQIIKLLEEISADLRRLNDVIILEIIEEIKILQE